MYLERVNINKCIENKGKTDERIENDVKLTGARVNTAKALHSVKYAFYFVSFFVQNLIVQPRLFPV
jgi:hypothetical protein